MKRAIMYMVGFMDPARRVPARIKTIAAVFIVLFCLALIHGAASGLQ